VGDGSFHLRFGIDLGVPAVYPNHNVRRLFEALDAKQGRIELARRARERAAAQEQKLVRDIHRAAAQRDKAAWDAYAAQKPEFDNARAERAREMKAQEEKRRKLSKSQGARNAARTRSYKNAIIKWQEKVAQARADFNKKEEEDYKFAGEEFKPRRFEDTEEWMKLLEEEPQRRSDVATVSMGKGPSDSESEDWLEEAPAPSASESLQELLQRAEARPRQPYDPLAHRELERAFGAAQDRAEKGAEADASDAESEELSLGP
jgi:hypothetical protein